MRVRILHPEPTLLVWRNGSAAILYVEGSQFESGLQLNFFVSVAQRQSSGLLIRGSGFRNSLGTPMSLSNNGSVRQTLNLEMAGSIPPRDTMLV